MQATIKEKREVAKGTLFVTFDLGGEDVDFQPGQYFWVELLDPPYERWEELEERLGALVPRVVAERGVVVVETDAALEPTLPLALRTTRRYGSARLTLFQP